MAAIARMEKKMSEKPILFSAPMVRAILDGRKTKTRRVVKPVRGFESCNICRPDFMADQDKVWWHGADTERVGVAQSCPYGQIGDLLWVREEHYRFGHWEEVSSVRTRTGRQKWAFVQDSREVLFDAPAEFRKGRQHKDPFTPAWHKRLARFMPRWASRITLEITDVRVERLQDIDGRDAIDEGIEKTDWKYSCEPFKNYNGGRPFSSPKASFKSLWESINGPDSWDANPWVWVIGFKRVESGKDCE